MTSVANLAAELESASLSSAARFFVTQRPWLDLYGINVRPVAPVGSVSSKPYVDPALIHMCLPDELLLEIFSRMSPYTLGRAFCVCRKWRYTIRIPVFWRRACLKAWQVNGLTENYKILHSKYDGSWKKMWLLRPRLRTDVGIPIRAGIAEWKIRNPVHIVCYYRYLRFYPSGLFLYKNSSQKVKDVVKCMSFRATKADCVFSGQHTLTKDNVDAALLYPGLRSTAKNPLEELSEFTAFGTIKKDISSGIISRFISECEILYLPKIILMFPYLCAISSRLRGTTVGANNRMDLLSLVTSGLNDAEASGPDEAILGVVEGWEEDETHNLDVPAISHRRGFTPFVFVPFDEVGTSVLNLPVDKMDYFVPG